MDLVQQQQQAGQLSGPLSALEWDESQKLLLGKKNVLNESVLQKYNLAGQLAQTGLAYVESLLLESLNDDGQASNAGLTIGEISRAGTRFLQNLVEGITKIQNDNGGSQERGLITPVRIEKMGFVDGVAPEIGETFQGGFLNDDDIVKIVLGVHIDGYSAQVAHTVVVKDYSKYKTAETQQEKQPEIPVEGRSADAVCGAYLASEAVIALLGLAVSTNIDSVPLLGSAGQVTGTHIRSLVETVAKAFRVQIVPGSRVRRVRRFLAGQDDIVAEQDLEKKQVEWTEESQKIEEELEIGAAASIAVANITGSAQTDSISAKKSKSNALALPGKSNNRKSIEKRYQEFLEERNNADNNVRVMPGEVWLVDIQMAGAPISPRGRIVLRPFQGYDESGITPQPTIYSRDVSMRYDLRLSNARSLLTQADKKASVFPFTISQIVVPSTSDAAVTGESGKVGKAAVPVELRAARLGLKELVNHHIFVPRPISVAVWEHSTYDEPTSEGALANAKSKKRFNPSKANKDDSLPVAREMSTVVLVPANIHPEGYGEVLRLTGGSSAGQPAFVHSKYQLEDADILKLLELVQDSRFGIRVRTVQPASEQEAFAVVGAVSQPSEEK